MGFVVAWLFCALFYFVQYALRSAPGVMMPELTSAFGLDVVAVSALVGLYYYTYSVFSIIAGAALDRLGAKYVIPAGILMVAIGAALFGLGELQVAQLGRLLQGAGSACAFTGAVYLATHGFPPRYLATAVGFTQCFGMMGASPVSSRWAQSSTARSPGSSSGSWPPPACLSSPFWSCA